MAGGRVIPNQPAVADYGIDAPGTVFRLVAGCFASIMLGIFIGSGVADARVVIPFAAVSIGLGLAAAAMVASSKVGIRRLWSRLLDGAALDGATAALDAGCGRGPVLVQVARRLGPDGTVHGVDRWRSRDVSGNHRSVAEANVGIAGVADRVVLHDADLWALPLPDGSVDLVTANLAFHRIADPQRRAAAVAELGRVLAPGGTALIVDWRGTATVADGLRAAGCHDVTRSGRRWLTFPPARVVTARR